MHGHAAAWDLIHTSIVMASAAPVGDDKPASRTTLKLHLGKVFTPLFAELLFQSLIAKGNEARIEDEEGTTPMLAHTLKAPVL
jgi:hypothetical protein